VPLLLIINHLFVYFSHPALQPKITGHHIVWYWVDLFFWAVTAVSLISGSFPDTWQP